MERFKSDNIYESNNYNFSEGRVSDVEDMVKIWWENLAQDGRDLKKEARKKREEEYNERIDSEDDHFITVFEKNEGVVGYIHCIIEKNKYESKENEDAIGWIKTLAVNKRKRGQGIGSKLIDQAENYFKNLGISKVYVKSNQVDFYKRSGFEHFTHILKKDLKY